MTKYIEFESFEKPLPKPDEEIYRFDDGDIIRADELTCYKCECRQGCNYVDDPYNTDGDCLALK